jgi:2-C-methyl-D-erythritol 4-phosphate cytidylyltransferase
MKITAIIAAGGQGKRMGQPKQLLPLAGKPMLYWTIEAFRGVPAVNEIIVAINRQQMGEISALNVLVVEGGMERQDSIQNALGLVQKGTDLVLIHDGARPLIERRTIESAIKEALEHGAAAVGVPVKDTLKRVGDDSIILNTVDRTGLWQVQTPQAFKYDIITRAYKNAKLKATDDSKLVEDLGIKVKMVMGSYENIKVTTLEDIRIAGGILGAKI